MKKHISNKQKNLWILAGTILFFITWWILSVVFDKNSMIFPSPVAAFKAMIMLLQKQTTYIYLGYSFLKMIIGFLIAFLIAFILGIFAGQSEKLRCFLHPFMSVLKSVPTVAIVYLFIVMFTPNLAPIYVVVLISLPVLYESVVGGVKSIDHEIIDACKIDGANKIKEIFIIRIPLAMPYILVGISSSLALSFKIEIMAEVLTGMTKNGIGAAISTLQGSEANLDKLFGYTLIIIILVLIFTFLSHFIKQFLMKKGIMKA